MIYGLGMVGLGMTMDLGLLVADNEFVRMIRRMLDGVPVNDESLAVDVIREVGIAGEFVTHQPEPLPADVAQTLREMVVEVEKEFS